MVLENLLPQTDWTMIGLWIALIIFGLISIWTSMVHITSFARLPLYIPLFFWAVTILIGALIWLKPKVDSLTVLLLNISPYYVMWVLIGIFAVIVLLPPVKNENKQK